ncbi:hypothetical protein AB3N58_13150 [Leptospira sp. WS60.C2]
MKKNRKSLKSGLIGISLALLLTAGFVSCTDSGAKKAEDPSAILYLVNNPNSLNDVQQICLGTYIAANSCVAGIEERFNPGIGCSLTKLDGKTTDDLNALKECVLAKINDQVAPCNLPQFKYALAQQALAGAFAACNTTYTTAAGTDVDLSGILVYQ